MRPRRAVTDAPQLRPSVTLQSKDYTVSQKLSPLRNSESSGQDCSSSPRLKLINISLFSRYAFGPREEFMIASPIWSVKSGKIRTIRVLREMPFFGVLLQLHAGEFPDRWFSTWRFSA